MGAQVQKKRPLVDHLATCQTCLISNQVFCSEAAGMGKKYKEHLRSMPTQESENFHETFVKDVIAARIKIWTTGNHEAQMAALKKLFEQ